MNGKTPYGHNACAEIFLSSSVISLSFSRNTSLGTGTSPCLSSSILSLSSRISPSLPSFPYDPCQGLLFCPYFLILQQNNIEMIFSQILFFVFYFRLANVFVFLFILHALITRTFRLIPILTVHYGFNIVCTAH